MVIRARRAALVASAAGVVLFAWTLSAVGWREVLDAFSRLGWGFVAIVAIGGARFVVRAAAWQRCVEPPHRLSLPQGLAAFLAGDAVATAIPVGLLASEPTKALLVARRLPVSAAVSSLAIENLLYSVSTGMMIAAGAAAFLYAVESGPRVRGAGAVAIFVFALSAAALVALARTTRRPLRRLATRLPHGRLGRWAAMAAEVEHQVLGFAHRGSPATWAVVFAFEISYHVLAVAEVWVTLLWILPGSGPSLLQAFVLESTNRLINVVFKFVPLRVGVDEMGSGLAADALALGPVAGVTLAIVRKARALCWAVVGFLVLAVVEGLDGRR